LIAAHAQTQKPCVLTSTGLEREVRCPLDIWHPSGVVDIRHLRAVYPSLL
jgi:hypothetical protein